MSGVTRESENLSLRKEKERNWEEIQKQLRFFS